MRINTILFSLATAFASQYVGAAPITGFDQFSLELINKIRANPQAAANQYLNGNLNEGVTTVPITSTAKQPLAWDLNIVAAAQRHSADMINNDFFSHRGSDGSSPFRRITEAGYDPRESIFSLPNYAESISSGGASRLTGVTAASTEEMINRLFIDRGEPRRAHRVNMMKDSFESIGISIKPSPSFDFVVETLNFAANFQGPFLTGVAYEDNDLDNFYTPGEGLAGLDVVAFIAGTNTQAGSTKTLEAGGYTLELAAGSYDLRISGKLGQMFVEDIALSNGNQKFDYTNASATVVPVPAAVWMFATGLLGLGGLSRRKSHV